MSIIVGQFDGWGEWLRYLDKLPWAAGVTKNGQAWDAFLRAGSLKVEALAARDEAASRIAMIARVTVTADCAGRLGL